MDTRSDQKYRWPAPASSVPRAAPDTVGGKRVFISHSSHEAWVAREICAAMEAAGLPCWVAPRDILPGQTWSKAIIDGLESSHAVVLILSRSADASNEVLREVEQASLTGKPIVAFRIENVTPSGGLSYFLAGTQWVNAVSRPLRPYIEQLVAGLTTLLRVSTSRQFPKEAPREVADVDLDHISHSADPKRGLLQRLLRDR